jgi:methylenetetrahydrofolate reductase (NADPH)
MIVTTALPGSSTSHLEALTRNSSIEATLPTEGDLSELRGVLKPNTLIYLSVPASRSHVQLAHVAKQVRQAEFEPVPHIAARNYSDHAALKNYIERITGEAGVRQVLVIAGDVERPAGPFVGEIDVSKSDLLQRHGITQLGISGYPEGHPNLSEAIIGRSLNDKPPRRAGSKFISYHNSASKGVLSAHG